MKTWHDPQSDLACNKVVVWLWPWRGPFHWQSLFLPTHFFLLTRVLCYLVLLEAFDRWHSVASSLSMSSTSRALQLQGPSCHWATKHWAQEINRINLKIWINTDSHQIIECHKFPSRPLDSRANENPLSTWFVSVVLDPIHSKKGHCWKHVMNRWNDGMTRTRLLRCFFLFESLWCLNKVAKETAIQATTWPLHHESTSC